MRKSIKLQPFAIASLSLGLLFFTACSDDSTTLATNECPSHALCIYKNISFSQPIMPDVYKASIRITESDSLRKGGEIESSAKKEIANTLNDILNLNKEKGLCEGGNYDLRPNIQYKDGAARDTVGYTLSFSLECDVPSEQKKDYDNFIAAVDKKINKNKFLSFLAPNVTIIATPEAWQNTQDKAFAGALNLAKESQKELSGVLDKKCVLAGADGVNNAIAPREFAKLSNMSASADISWELPAPKEQEVSAKIQVKYICK